MPDQQSILTQLHVIHDLGGGSATWLRDFCLADKDKKNLILKSFTQNDAMGCGVALYAHVLDELPLKIWYFNNQIQATVATHAEYQRILDSIITQYRVDALLVSSVIGHSLDVLNTTLPTVVINHDYFPYCPAINIHFGEVCNRCDEKRIDLCYHHNPQFNPFITFLPPQRMDVRERFLSLIIRPNVTMVVPSQSVMENLARLDGRFKQAAFVTIPHGYGRELRKIPVPEPAMEDRLRILVLGQLSDAKGMQLLQESAEAILGFAEIYLIGCRELGECFKYKTGIHVLESYEVDELPGHIAAINPHLGLLLSIVPETFNYALTELMMLEIPVAATRVGSFPERIDHRQNGFLYEPNQAALIALLKTVNDDRSVLHAIRGQLRGWKPYPVTEMVVQYHRVLQSMAPHSTISIENDLPGKKMQNQPESEAQLEMKMQAQTLSSMWKEIKRLNVQLSAINHVRQDLLHQQHALMNHQQTLTAHQQVLDQRLAEEQNISRQLRAQVEELAKQNEAQQTQLLEAGSRIRALNETIQSIFASTSWKVTRPVRALGHLLRKLKILFRAMGNLLRKPGDLTANLAHLFRLWRAGGNQALKVALVNVQNLPVQIDAWEKYRQAFKEKIEPHIVRRIQDMAVKPSISIIVPTYNTSEIMLREMLDSVQAQLYPHWELCIADDGSDQPHVKRILEEYASADRRIKLHLGTKNHGVSHASNRALELVTSEFVVLLDHDDLLEEQALFRVAESIVQDDPDMVYSDEVLITPDASQVTQYVYRPVFSPEFLRGHPYIVHLVGFRTKLVRDIGGFDEHLSISQDYDLVLRATEQAQTIVHIPEILYRWRVHANSAGHQKMHQVMDVSKNVLQQHLARCGDSGYVMDGAGFNFFDVRYPLKDELKVAIIIPTKNHGELLKQCIQSLNKTILGVKYDIVVIDHESDAPGTLTYLASISDLVRVIRYEGKFNFSKINNWAISQLPADYSHYLFCNNDIEAMEPGWLERMLELGQQPAVGIVGAKLFYPDHKTIQHAGVCIGAFGRAEHYGKFLCVPADCLEPGYFGGLVINHEVAAVTGACLLIKRDVFARIAGFDENIAVGFGDVDLCLRAGEQGYSVLFCPYAQLIHHESYTRGTSTTDTHPEDTALFQTKWQKMLGSGDPYFNPSLSLTSTTWQNANPIPCHLDIQRRLFRRDAVSGLQKISY